ncbi:MAG: hypothetical protein JNJ57_13035 [Saprospiraceae bacterium]|nr:hypothetical protein [Saprospiraceae bacterium]
MTLIFAMSILERIFNFKGSKNDQQPNIPFGRFSDAYKTDAQQAAFDRALEYFDKGDTLGSYREFFNYIRDENNSAHLSTREENNAIHFEFWQGSRLVRGVAGPEYVKAESKVARAGDLNVGFLRRLMEVNFNLKFSRFALDPDNNLCILFDTDAVDASPLKLLHALRELSIQADKQDDLLLDEFKTLEPAEERTYGDIPEEEKEVKYRYIRKEIEAAFAVLDAGKPDPNQFPGTFAYLMLALAFKLDYLVRPEGFMMDVLERIHGIYFAKNQLTPQVKVQQIRKEFQKLLDRPKEELFVEMYRTRSTFGVNPPVTHGSLATFIEGELANMEWPIQQGFEKLALAVPQYIVGFTLFHQAPPKPDRDLMHLFVQIMEADFFRELGFYNNLKDASGKLNKMAITKEIARITQHHKLQYPKFRINTDKLDFASQVLFTKSYLQAVKGADLTRAD